MQHAHFPIEVEKKVANHEEAKILAGVGGGESKLSDYSYPE